MVPDLRGLLVFAIVGLFCSAAAIVIGLPIMVYWLWTHLKWVP